MKNWSRLFLLSAAAAACAISQSGQGIDNDQVRVVTVTDQPHVKSQPHDHKLNRVMVYLNAGAQEIVQDGKKTLLKFRAGEARFSPATGTHTSEIVSDTPVTIVELELKKPGDPTKKITTPLDPPKIDPKNYKVEFENDQVRVTRVKFPAHGGAPMHEHVLNRVIVYLTELNTRLTMSDGSTDKSVHKAGETSWGGPAKHKEDNLLDKPVEVIVVEFKY